MPVCLNHCFPRYLLFLCYGITKPFTEADALQFRSPVARSPRQALGCALSDGVEAPEPRGAAAARVSWQAAALRTWRYREGNAWKQKERGKGGKKGTDSGKDEKVKESSTLMHQHFASNLVSTETSSPAGSSCWLGK